MTPYVWIGPGLDMAHFRPFDNPRYVPPKKRKAVPVPPEARGITAFAGPYIRSRDHQPSPLIIPPPPIL